MPTDTHEQNAILANGSDQANRVSHSCFISKARGLSLDNTTHETHSALPEQNIPILPPLAIASDPSQSQDQSGTKEPSPHERARNEADSEQEHERQLQRGNAQEQQSLPTPGRNKRKLNMVKCERCRDDKKRCVRTDSERCDRCMEKGLPCSEGTRVKRPKKIASRPSSPLHSNVPPSIDSGVFETLWRKLIFLKSYHKMMIMARERLRSLETDMRTQFQYTYPLRVTTAVCEFKNFVDFELPAALFQLWGDLSTMKDGSKALTMRSMLESQSLTLFVDTVEMFCPECSPAYRKPTMHRVGESLDPCRGFLVQQHLFENHWELFQPELDEDAKDRLNREKERGLMFSVEVPEQAGAIFESLELFEVATYCRSLGLYYFDLVELATMEAQSEYRDCLGRTRLHRFLDYLYKNDPHIRLHSEALFDNFSTVDEWNSQDILGRTPLHMLLQFDGLDRCRGKMESLLEAGVDPGLRTTYGSLPLHYAAANGHAEMCEVLMGYKTKFEIGARDLQGVTALQYAMIRKHPGVVTLLMAHYKEAGLDQDLANAYMTDSRLRNGFPGFLSQPIVETLCTQHY